MQPLMTPTPMPFGSMPMDVSQIDPQIMGRQIAMDTVGLWNAGINDAWGYISTLIVVMILIFAVISLIHHIQNLE